MLSGQFPGCNYIKLACRRYLDMLKMAESGKYGFTFSKAHACDFLAFTEELPLVEDNFRGIETIELEPWQIWIGCALYGFRDQYGFRYVTECYLEVPRKNAKSVLGTAIGLYDVRNPDARTPLVLIAASTLDQANRVYTPIRKTIQGPEASATSSWGIVSQELREAYKLEATDKIVRCGLNSGTIEKVASIGERQDGWNPTTIIMEELHAQNPDVYAVLKSAMGSRGGQLLFQITTAGRNAFGLAWDNRKAAIRVLEGHEENFQYFAAIYTVDKEDLEDAFGNKTIDRVLNDEQLWIKACPNLGISFNMAAFHMLARSARNKPQEREEFLRTRVNVWTNAASKLFDVELWRRGANAALNIEEFRGKRAWIGGDMSTSDDLTSIGIVFELDDDMLAVFSKFYAAADAPLFSDPDFMGMTRDWLDRSYISAAREGRVDQREVEKDIREWCGMFDVQAIGMDPAMASQMMFNLEDDKLPVVKFLNKAYMMSAPVDDLMAKINADSKCYVVHDDNPVLTWCVSNVHGEKRKDGTILMFKDDTDSLNKIDGAVAVAIANGVRMNPEFAGKVKKPSIYERRGLSAIDRASAAEKKAEKQDA